MRRVFGLLVLASVLIGACHRGSPPKAPERSVQNERLGTITFHVDTTFTDQESRAIDTAAQNLDDQTGGMIHVSVIHDLDFDAISILAKLRNENLIMRATAHTPIIMLADGPNSDTVGLCDVNLENPDPAKARKIYLVIERIKTLPGLVHVAMHEMLHALFLKHVSDHNAIMYYATTTIYPGYCMLKADAVEFCRVYDCDPERINYCR